MAIKNHGHNAEGKQSNTAFQEHRSSHSLEYPVLTICYNFVTDAMYNPDESDHGRTSRKAVYLLIQTLPFYTLYSFNILYSSTEFRYPNICFYSRPTINSKGKYTTCAMELIQGAIQCITSLVDCTPSFWFSKPLRKNPLHFFPQKETNGFKQSISLFSILQTCQMPASFWFTFQSLVSFKNKII